MLFWVCLDRSETLTVSMSQEDLVVNVGDSNCDGPINIPYEIFNHRTLYVSFYTQEPDLDK